MCRSRAGYCNASQACSDEARTVAARIIDKDDGFTPYTTTITIENVAPSIPIDVDNVDRISHIFEHDIVRKSRRRIGLHKNLQLHLFDFKTIILRR